ncbi:porin [Azonexus sp.]|uniref:porin n=1 Tax=Azonexus sp. TaxID=1872668 RepID=UPI0039E4504B
MQKKLIALAIAAAASGAAFAQTNVTIYGIADVGYVGVDRDHFKYQNNINSGVLSTSRIGFKGAEDLGNGLKAIFTLEYGLLLDNNTGIGVSNGGVANARQQFVGLTGGFGTAVAGRLQTAGLDFTVAGSALAGSTAIGAVNLVGGPVAGANNFPLLNAVSRANNAVAYISPSFGGATFAINHARLSESAAADDRADNSATLLAVNYDGGPLTAGLVYGLVSVEKTGAATALTPLNAFGVANAKNSDAKEWGVRAGYDFGVVKLQAAYQQAKLEQGLNGLGVSQGNLKNKRWVVSATVPVTAKIAVIGEYAQAKVERANNLSDNKDKAFSLAATYSLSKRTTAYAAFATQDFNNSQYNGSLVVVNGIAPGTANRLDANYYGVGLRHAF